MGVHQVPPVPHDAGEGLDAAAEGALEGRLRDAAPLGRPGEAARAQRDGRPRLVREGQAVLEAREAVLAGPDRRRRMGQPAGRAEHPELDQEALAAGQGGVLASSAGGLRSRQGGTYLEEARRIVPRAGRRDRPAALAVLLGFAVAANPILVHVPGLENQVVRIDAEGVVAQVGAVEALKGAALEEVVELDPAARPRLVGEPADRPGDRRGVVPVPVGLERQRTRRRGGRGGRRTRCVALALGQPRISNFFMSSRGSRDAQSAGSRTQVPAWCSVTPHEAASTRMRVRRCSFARSVSQETALGCWIVDSVISYAGSLSVNTWRPVRSALLELPGSGSAGVEGSASVERDSVSVVGDFESVEGGSAIVVGGSEVIERDSEVIDRGSASVVEGSEVIDRGFQSVVAGSESVVGTSAMV